ncbi:hypothetical protein TWF718_008668 [Orbilia javanica]|uniref:O-methylsterigmatocystin oxidoreductase n=1 Tax=Orbilia javanica TaxID=47235 RepID=A0AAN8RFK7_9PEZI
MNSNKHSPLWVMPITYPKTFVTPYIDPSKPSVLGLILAILAYGIYRYVNRDRRTFPPGPKPLPLVGNIFDFPAPGVPEYQHWFKHKDQYGGISSVTALGTTLVFVHDRTIARDILERMSIKTSGRPVMQFAGELCGYGTWPLFQGYTSLFRQYRKLFHQSIGTKALVSQLRDVQELEVHRQLVRCLRRPEDWSHHLKTTASATTLKVTYGYTVEPEGDDVLVEHIDKMMQEFTLAAVPSTWAVDLIPALRYLPEWFPGASFKKTARVWRKHVEDTVNMPYQFARRQMAADCHHQSYVSRMVGEFEASKGNDGAGLSPEDEQAIILTAASFYAAGADTTVITLTSFIAAMVLFPEVQRKAQEEIDRVVGTDRLPTFDDREGLPYINAVVKEALRWWTVLPLCLIHVADQDFEYNGYCIPKGAYILPSLWWALNDPEVYTSPEKFDPERFLSPRNEPDPAIHQFGYGRRICAGRFLADASVYLSIVKTLAVFNINKPVDKDGKEVDIEVKPTAGILNYLQKFNVRITPRSPKHEDLVKQLEAGNLWEKGDSEAIKRMKNDH